MAEEEPRQRVARLVKEGRLKLGLSLSAAARRAGVDRATWTGVEKAVRIPRDAQAAAIERAVGLPADTIMSILEGRPSPGRESNLPVDPELRKTRRQVITATPEELVSMRQIIEDVMGTAAADEFLRRAIALRSPAPQGGEEERAARRGKRAAG